MTPTKALRDITLALNLAKFLGNLYRLGLIFEDFMVTAIHTLLTNLRSLQHVEALGYLATCTEMNFWLTGQGLHSACLDYVKQIADLRDNSSGLSDLSPLPNSKEATSQSYGNLLNLFDKRNTLPLLVNGPVSQS